MTTPDLVPRHRLHVDPMADCFCEMDVSATGNYVTFEDYERLQSRLDAIEAMARRQHRDVLDTPERSYDAWEQLGAIHALILDGKEKP